MGVGLSKDKIKYHTFGCKVNTYDTGLIQKNLSNLTADKKIHILNTCAVTAEATKDALRLTKKLKKTDPDSMVVVTGCSAQIDKNIFENENSVDLLIGNSHKEEIKDILEKHLLGLSEERFFHKNIFRKYSLGDGGGVEENHSRSFLKIQDGCNSFCSFLCDPAHQRKK